MWSGIKELKHITLHLLMRRSSSHPPSLYIIRTIELHLFECSVIFFFLVHSLVFVCSLPPSYLFLGLLQQNVMFAYGSVKKKNDVKFRACQFTKLVLFVFEPSPQNCSDCWRNDGGAKEGSSLLLDLHEVSSSWRFPRFAFTALHL